jgi:hypothetical protein
LDADLGNAIWRELSFDTVGDSALLFPPDAGTLLLSEQPLGATRVDVISLSTNLKPVATGTIVGNPNAPCEFFQDTTVALIDPNLHVETLNLSESRLYVDVADTAIVMPATARIQLRPIAPTVADLCERGPGSAPRLACSVDRESGAFTLSFASREGVKYDASSLPKRATGFTRSKGCRSERVLGSGPWDRLTCLI